jgi:hypothetical protein
MVQVGEKGVRVINSCVSPRTKGCSNPLPRILRHHWIPLASRQLKRR